jgi:hypothetical protein
VYGLHCEGVFLEGATPPLPCAVFTTGEPPVAGEAVAFECATGPLLLAGIVPVGPAGPFSCRID